MNKRIRRLASAVLALAIPLSIVACGDDEPSRDSVAVTGVTLDQPTMSLDMGGPGKPLAATVWPADATNKDVVWSDGATGIVSIAGTGATVTVKPEVPGWAVVTVATRDAGKTAECMVEVVEVATVAVAGVTISPAALSLTLGGANGALTAAVQPDDATNKNLTWSSEPGGVVAVAGTNGGATVTPVAAGTATITVASEADPSKTAACAVAVAAGGAPVVYMGGYFGLYANAGHDQAIGDQDIYAIGVDAAGNVHAAGQRNDSGAALRWAPAYYRNGAMTVLPTMPDAREGWANSMFVTEDGHAYVAGYQENNPYYSKLALLWLDGEPVELQGVGEADGSGEIYGTRANAVCVHNGVVYVAGMAQDESHANHGAIWRDGVKHVMPHYTELVDMAIDSAGGIYVMGGSQIYKVAPDLASMQEVPHAGGSKSGMCVEGMDLYVAGLTGDDAVYWKNGTLHGLPRPAGADWSWADVVFVRGGVTYIGGTRSVPGVHRVQLWVDGQPVAADDPMAIKESFTDPTRARPLAIHAR
jgi:hypothetical protein